MAEIAGLKLIVPTSVSSAGSGNSSSVSATGKVTFASCTELIVNGVFSSTYDNYLIVVQATQVSGSGSGGQTHMQLTSSGTPAAGTSYTWQRLAAYSTTVNGARSTSQPDWRVTEMSNSLRNGIHIYVYGPALSQPTAVRSVSGSGLDGAAIHDYAGTHSVSTAYDGFELNDEGSNRPITGTLTVYGLSQ